MHEQQNGLFVQILYGRILSRKGAKKHNSYLIELKGSRLADNHGLTVISQVR